jgi:hypothetical protein
MKKFECTVTREDKFIIEFDEDIINEEWMEEFRESFYNFHTLKEHAEHIAQFKARFGEHDFIEGYGVPLVNGKIPCFAHDGSIEKGINIQIVSEDEECEVEVVEINE